MPRCIRCGRELKNQKSIEEGIGSGCKKKSTVEKYSYTRLGDYFNDTET